jgi:glycosyltransferase involved in cell wall biosynthesis
MNFFNIPILILCYNRLTCLRLLLQALDKAGYGNIWLLDNNSTYLPLLDFYQQQKHRYQIFRFSENYGHGAFCLSCLDPFREDYFVTTDPDIVPVEDCPADFLKRFYQLINAYEVDKVGFSFKHDDIPVAHPKREAIIDGILCFRHEEVEPNVFRAPIDTSFALNRPGFIGGYSDKALRTGGAYLARHMSDYYYPGHLPEDEVYYMQSHPFSNTSYREVKSSFDVLPPWVTPAMARSLVGEGKIIV